MLLRWRNRLLADPRFRRWVARVPIGRAIARRRSAALFDLVAGFVYAQTLAAWIELSLSERLRVPASIEALAEATGIAAVPLGHLLRAGEALGLAERDGARWALGAAGAALVDNPAIAAMVAHHRLFYADMADPVALLGRGGGGGALAGFWPYARGTAGEAAGYSRLMSASQAMVAEQALAAYRFARHKRMLDIGGGEGAFARAVARTHPRLDVAMLDLPAVADRARGAGGIAVIDGDFRTDALPGGFDLMTLVRILHDHDDATVAALLGAVARALVPGGRMLIVEPLAATPGAAGVSAYFEWYLLAMGSGRPRRFADLRALLTAAGFDRVTRHRAPLPGIASVISARHGKPSK